MSYFKYLVGTSWAIVFIFFLASIAQSPTEDPNILTDVGEGVNDVFFKPLAISDYNPSDLEYRGFQDYESCENMCMSKRGSNLKVCQNDKEQACEFRAHDQYSQCHNKCQVYKENSPSIANPTFEDTRMPAGHPYGKEWPY